MIHLKKFTLRHDWVPIKLDVSIDMPEELDISHLRGNGPQEGEILMPDIAETPGVFIHIYYTYYNFFNFISKKTL
jgi:ubiquitin carboxyl-terminal hydrolase 5/13